MNLIRNEQVLLKLNISIAHVFQVTVEVVWSDGKPVPEAKVVIRNKNGQILNTDVTEKNGIFITSLAEGSYAVEVSHKDLSENANRTITGETTISFTFNASLRRYILTVEVTGDNAVPVNGALVVVESDGDVISSSQTNGGIVTFNLKDGVYNVVVTLNSEQEEKVVVLDRDTLLSMPFQKGVPPELSMSVLVLLGAIITACFGAWCIQKRRQKGLQF